MKWGAHKADMRIAAKNAPKIRAAIKQSFDALTAYESYLRTMPNPDEKLSLARVKAQAWAIMNIRFDREPMRPVLRRVLADGFVLGRTSANDALRKTKKYKVKAVDNDNLEGFIDWDNWTPGSQSAALLLRPTGAFKKLLDDLDISIKGFNTTDYDKLGSALADSVALGLAPKRAAKLIQNIVASPARALTIAVTEQARAINTATVERYQEMGVEKMEWVSALPCDICAENEGKVVEVGKAFPSGDTQPPVHPNCRCALLPIPSEFPMTIGGENVGDMDLLDISIVTGVEGEQLLTPDELLVYQQKVNPEYRVGGELPMEYYSALSTYKSQGYKRINEVLRDPIGSRERYDGFEIARAEGTISNMDRAIELAPPLPQSITTYRGISGDIADRFLDMEIGTVFQDNAFVSTTLKKKLAEAFAISDDTRLVLEIISPKGQRGVMLDEFGALTEKEWLLPRGLKYEVVFKSENSVTVRVLP
jgi:SPP1 gp7 family putative phage head morphogenesis protein